MNEKWIYGPEFYFQLTPPPFNVKLGDPYGPSFSLGVEF